MFELSEIIFWVLIFYIIFSESGKTNTDTKKELNEWRLKNNLLD